MRASCLQLSALLVSFLGCATDDVASDGGLGGGGGKADGVGPGANAKLEFRAKSQKGGLWELGSGELFTAFQTGHQSLPGARTRYDFSFALVSPDDRDTGDIMKLGPAGSCIDEWDRNYGCEGGLLTPSTQKALSIVSRDDRILTATTISANGGHHPRLILIDPQGAPGEVFADLPQISAPGAPSRYTNNIQYRLERLPSGPILFSASLAPTIPDRSFVLDDDGTILGEIEGFARGHRDDAAEILVLRKPTRTEHEYLWWNPATSTTSFGGSVPSVTPGAEPIAHRPTVTPDGRLVLWPYDEYWLRYSRTGVLELDERMPPNARIVGISPKGDALVVEHVNVAPNVWDWSLVQRDGDGDARPIYTKAQLRTDTAWNLSESTFSYPHFGGIYPPVFDDAGNAYVPMIKNAGGDTRTETYMVGFTATGARMFGVKLDTVYGRRCLPHGVLPSGRLAVLCEHRLTNELYLLGE